MVIGEANKDISLWGIVCGVGGLLRLDSVYADEDLGAFYLSKGRGGCGSVSGVSGLPWV